MNKEQELRPCPFCGGTNIALLNGGLGNRFVHCDDCRATTDDGSEERAIAAWNRRSPPAVAAGGVTEAQVEAAARVIAERLGFNPKPGLFIEHREMACAAITAALAVRDEGIREGWQPIETAPKDGTEVLLWGVCWRDHQAYAPDRNVGWWAGDHLGWQTRGQDEDIDPTHWRPLPTPPSRGEGV